MARFSLLLPLQMQHDREWGGGRPWPDELSRFLYPLRYLLAYCDSATLALAGRNIKLIPPENPDLEVSTPWAHSFHY